MNKTIYRQYDTQWGKLPYPTKKVTLSSAGCGCLSVFHCAIENPKYKKLTVKKCQQYMIQFSRAGQGTDWSGIKTGLEHYGYKVHWKQSDGMKEIFAALKNSEKKGVILFHKGKAPNGKVWTSSGHYVAFTNYRIKDGKHQFYTKDSGPRKHDGWHSYEKSMKGCIKFVYICKSIPSETSKKKESAVAKPVETKPLSRVDKGIAWAKKIAADNTWHYVRYDSGKKAHECPICHSHPVGKFHGWNCIGFSYACWFHGMELKNNCNNHVIDNLTAEKILKASAADALSIARKHIGLTDIKVIRNGGKTVPQKNMKAGDICMYYKGNEYIHTFFYIGDGKMIDCTSAGSEANNIKMRNALAPKVCIRYVGK